MTAISVEQFLGKWAVLSSENFAEPNSVANMDYNGIITMRSENTFGVH